MASIAHIDIVAQIREHQEGSQHELLRGNIRLILSCASREHWIRLQLEGGMQYDRWTKISDEWRESPSQIRHYIKTNTATGQAAACIEESKGGLLAEFSIGQMYPTVTLVEASGSRTYALGKGREIEPSTSYEDVTKLVQRRLAEGTLVLVSGTDVS